MQSVETLPSPVLPCFPDLGSEESVSTSSVKTAEQTVPFPKPVKLTSVEDLALAVVPKPGISVEAEIVLSPTQARMFLGCSARWWFKYGLSLPEPKTSSLAF